MFRTWQHILFLVSTIGPTSYQDPASCTGVLFTTEFMFKIAISDQNSIIFDHCCLPASAMCQLCCGWPRKSPSLVIIYHGCCHSMDKKYIWMPCISVSGLLVGQSAIWTMTGWLTPSVPLTSQVVPVLTGLTDSLKNLMHHWSICRT